MWRDFCDGEFFGIRQSFDPLKILFFIGVRNHDDFMRPDAGDDLLRVGSWLAFVTLKTWPIKRKTANFSMTAEFDPKTFIGTVVSIAPKANPIKLTGQIDAPATNLIGQLDAVFIRIEMRRQAFLRDLHRVNTQRKRTIPSTLHDGFIAWNIFA